MRNATLREELELLRIERGRYLSMDRKLKKVGARGSTLALLSFSVSTGRAPRPRSTSSVGEKEEHTSPLSHSHAQTPASL